MDTKKFGIIIDGDEPSTGNDTGPAIVDGGTKPPVRTEEPKRTVPTIAGFDSVSPFDIIADPGTGTGNRSGDTAPRRRGRPPGSRNATGTGTPSIAASQKAGSLVADLESLLLSVHMMGAAFTGVAELKITDAEAKQLSDAIQNVANQYTVSMDPKKLAIAQLGITALTIYGPRVVVVMKGNADKPKPVVVPNAPPKPAAPNAAAPQPINERRSGTTGTAGSARGVDLSQLSPCQLNPEFPIPYFGD